MRDLDPQTTADFWDAYLRAAGTGTNLTQVSRAFPEVGVPVSIGSGTACAPITFAWDLVLLPPPIASGLSPRAA